MKQHKCSWLFAVLFAISLIEISCSKSSDSTPTNTDTQKQIVNTKWYYDSTVIWDKISGYYLLAFHPKSYIYFGSDSVFSTYDWTGITYDVTTYPYVFENGKIKCDYFYENTIPFFNNNQLIISDVTTLPRVTDVTGYDELMWDFYHK